MRDIQEDTKDRRESRGGDEEKEGRGKGEISRENTADDVVEMGMPVGEEEEGKGGGQGREEEEEEEGKGKGKEARRT